MSIVSRTILFAAGVTLVGVGGYGLYRILAKKKAAAAESVVPKKTETSSPAPEPSTTASAPPSVIPTPPPIVVEKAETEVILPPPAEEPTNMAPEVAIEVAEIELISLISDRRIICYGVPEAKDASSTVIVNAVPYEVTIDMPALDVQSVKQLRRSLQELIAIKTDVGRGDIKCVSTALKDLAVATFTAAPCATTRAPGREKLFIQLTPSNPALLDGHRQLYLIVERGDFLVPTGYCTIGDDVWKELIDILIQHIAFAVDGLDRFERSTVFSLRDAIQTQFRALAEQLAVPATA